MEYSQRSSIHDGTKDFKIQKEAWNSLDLTEVILNLSLLLGEVWCGSGWVDSEVGLPPSPKRTAFPTCPSLH